MERGDRTVLVRESSVRESEEISLKLQKSPRQSHERGTDLK